MNVGVSMSKLWALCLLLIVFVSSCCVAWFLWQGRYANDNATFTWQTAEQHVLPLYQPLSVEIPLELPSLSDFGEEVLKGVRAARFSPDNRAVWLEVEHGIVVIDIATGGSHYINDDNPEELRKLQAAFADESTYQVRAGSSAIYLNNVSTEKDYRFKTEAGVNFASPVLFDSEKDYLAAGTDTGKVLVWHDVLHGARLHILKAGHHAKAIQALNLSADGRVLVSMAKDGSVTAWDVAKSEKIATTTTLDDMLISASSLQLSYDGRFVVVDTWNLLALWDVKYWQQHVLFQENALTSDTIAFHPQRPLFAFFDDSNESLSLYTWASSNAPDSSVAALVLVDGNLLTSEGKDLQVSQAWSLEHQNLTHLFFSPDGTYLAAIANDDTLHLWHTQEK